MNRPWKIWALFGIAAIVLLGVAAWVSRSALRLERAQVEAQAQAELEERVRLALWRIDSLLAPIIAQESARPYFTYAPFYPADRAYNKMYEPMNVREAVLPSPLLTQSATNVLLHFQFDAASRLTSPEIPEGSQRGLALKHFTTTGRVEVATRRVEEFRKILGDSGDTILRAAPPMDQNQFRFNSVLNDAYEVQFQNRKENPPQSQAMKNSEELQARAQSLKQAFDVSAQNALLPSPALSRTGISEGLFKAVWVRDALFLVRRVAIGADDYVQGCWLNWPALEQTSLEAVRDLLPGARLKPVEASASNPELRLLASLPVQLTPGPIELTASTPSAMRYTLLLAWSCIAIAGLAVALLLGGTISLSERRGAFVSAVTHELRTPLTTFKMYSEMLAGGMVPENSRRDYLATLCAEANRLSHLVENVLAYARLERGGARRRIECVTARSLVDRVMPRLSQRAEQAGMTLRETIAPGDGDLTVETDTGVVEQILFNLVDNACKYATVGNRAIYLESHPASGRFFHLRVRDDGPGLSPEIRHRLFQPFSKSADDAAHSAPGVGLGLALSRRLARSIGGDLKHEQEEEPGATFDLLLPKTSGLS